MNSKNSLLVQHKNGELYDLEETYSCVCLDIPNPVASEIQDISSQQWYGESGEDAYVPNVIKFKAFDWDIKCGIKASSTSNLNTYLGEMISLLTNNGVFSIYSSFVDTGFSDVYYKGVKDQEQFIDGNGMSVITFTLSLRVTKPESNVYPDDNTNPQNLVA